MKLNATDTKALVERFTELKPGQSINLPSPLPGLMAAETQLILREKMNDKQWWQFEMYWLGVLFAEVTAEVHNDKLIFEVL